MTNYDLTSIGAVSASAKLAHIRANQEPDQSSYNAAWLHGYADALTNVADALEHQKELMDSMPSAKLIQSPWISIPMAVVSTGTMYWCRRCGRCLN